MPTATSPDKVLDVLLSFVEDPYNSICDVAQQHNISLTSAHKTLQKNKFHPNKIHFVQELSYDFDRRILRFDDGQNNHRFNFKTILLFRMR